MITHFLAFIPVFLCWGSFLNVVAYRLLINESFVCKRSYCPHCKHKIAWYDLIPLISFFLLKGKCRYCHKKITWLYPFIEIATALIFTLMIIFIEPSYWLGYGIFFSALIVNIRTDLQKMVIPRITSLYLAPIGCICAFLKLLPISFYQSLMGSIFGYFTLFIIAKTFYYTTKKQGLGEGDFDLLALIGAFTGIQGAWMSLFIGSVAGSIIGIFLILVEKYSRNTKIPFGPFLAFGALFYLFSIFL